MSEPTADTTPAETSVRPRLILGVILLVVLLTVLFVRPGGDAGGTDKVGEQAATPDRPKPVMPSATPATPPSEEVFCNAYRDLAGSQGDFAAVPDEKATELLREAADALLATGVPVHMPAAARNGFFVELSGVYSSMGLQLDREAIPGAFDGGPHADPPGSFGTFLETYCPAW